MQDCSISSVLAKEILQSCTQPSIYILVNILQNIHDRQPIAQLWVTGWAMKCLSWFKVWSISLRCHYMSVVIWVLLECSGVSFHWPFNCLFDSSFRLTTKTPTKKGFCFGIPPTTSGFPVQRASNWYMPYHHSIIITVMLIAIPCYISSHYIVSGSVGLLQYSIHIDRVCHLIHHQHSHVSEEHIYCIRM